MILVYKALDPIGESSVNYLKLGCHELKMPRTPAKNKRIKKKEEVQEIDN